MSRRVRFHVHFKSQWGQNVFVVGNCPALGSWEPLPHLRMQYSDVANWDTTIEVPSDSEYLYTYVVINDFYPNGIPLWEPRVDRVLAPSSTETRDVWGLGPKIQQCQFPAFIKPNWGKIYRCPMPFSRMFDPEGVVYGAIKELQIHTIVILVHRGECDYHTGQDLQRMYLQDGFEVLSYAIDDYCVPRDMKAFRDFVSQVRDRLSRQRNVCVHCHAGTGRTGLLLACLAKLEAPAQPVESVIRFFKDSFHGSIETPQAAFVAQF